MPLSESIAAPEPVQVRPCGTVTGQADEGEMVRRYQSWPNWSVAQPPLSHRLPPATVEVLARAYRFAAQWHADQRRPAGEPYVEHLLQALEVLLEGGQSSPDLLVAALLHDVVEDTDCTLDEVRERFGDAVADHVAWLTKPETPPGGDPAVARAEYLRRLADAPLPVLAVKLADRYSNVQHLDMHPRADKRRRYYRETVEHFVPLARRIPFYNALFTTWAAGYAHLAAPSSSTP